MALTAASLQVVIGADTAAFERAMQRAEKTTTSAAKAMELQTRATEKVDRAFNQLQNAQINAARAAGNHEGALRKVSAALSMASSDSTRYYQLLAQQARITQQAKQEAEQLAAAEAKATGLANFEKGINNLSASMTRLVAAGGAFTLLVEGWNFAQSGESLKQVETSFQNLATKSGLASDALLASMQRASGGTISNAQLMQSANMALIKDNEEMARALPQLIEIARSSAVALGRDTSESYARIVEGIQKAEPELLDELGLRINLMRLYAEQAAQMGITAQQLSMEQKQHILLNEVLRQGGDMMERTGITAESTNGAMQRMSVGFQNAKDQGAQLASTLVSGVSAGWQMVFDAASGAEAQTRAQNDAMNQARQGHEAFFGVVTELTPQIETLHNAGGEWASRLQEIVDASYTNEEAFRSLTTGLYEEYAATTAVTDAAAQLAARTNEVAEAHRNAADAIFADYEASINNQIAKENLSMANEMLAAMASGVERGFYSTADAGALLAQQLGIDAQQAEILIGKFMQLAALQNNPLKLSADGAKAVASSVQGAQRELDAAYKKWQRDTAHMIDVVGDAGRKTAKAGEAAAKRGAKAGASAAKAGAAAARKEENEAKRAAEARAKLQEKYADEQAARVERLAELEKKTGEELLEFDRDLTERKAAGRAKLDRDLRGAGTQARQDEAMDDLDLAGVTDKEQLAQLQARERAQQAALDRQRAYEEEARKIAEGGDAELAQRTYDIRMESSEAKQRLEEEYAKRQAELAGNPEALAELDRHYAEAQRKIRENEEEKIRIAQEEAAIGHAADKQRHDEIIARSEEEKAKIIADSDAKLAAIQQDMAEAGMAFDGAAEKANGFTYALEGIPREIDVQVRTTYSSTGTPPPSSGSDPNGATGRQHIPGYALGGFHPGGLATVHPGELLQGANWAALTKGTTTGYFPPMDVTNRSDTRQALGGITGGSVSSGPNNTYNIHLPNGGSQNIRELEAMIKRILRDLGKQGDIRLLTGVGGRR